MQLRLLAPFLPYVTEEVWSWSHEDSVHSTSWPESDTDLPSVPQDPRLLTAALLAAAKAAGVRHLPQRAARLLERLVPVSRDTRGAVELFFDTPSALARLEGTGVVKTDDAEALGLVGVAARACGLVRDARLHHPSGAYRDRFDTVIIEESGDVYARANIRRREISSSLDWVRRGLGRLPEGELRRPLGALRPQSLALAQVEGWRGEIVHVALTDAQGRLSRYKIVDPSFRNWSALAMALRGEQISDFPLCNKSFNLSYCGVDL